MSHGSLKVALLVAALCLPAGCGDSGESSSPAVTPPTPVPTVVAPLPSAEVEPVVVLPVPSAPDPVQEAMNAIEQEMQGKREEAMKPVVAAVDQRIRAAAGMNDLATAQRLTRIKEQALAGKLVEPEDVSDLDVWHPCRVAEAKIAGDRLKAYDALIAHYTGEVMIDQATRVQNVKRTLENQMSDATRSLIELEQLSVQWTMKVYEFKVDAKNNAREDGVWIGARFQPGEMIYLFPNTSDKWYTGRYEWVDYRGRIGAAKPPFMKLIYRMHGQGNPVTVGKEIVVREETDLTLYCEDRWPENNEGFIRTTVVVFTPTSLGRRPAAAQE